MKNTKALVPAALILPFCLVTILFALWGFANDITNPMVAAFKNILLISNFESAWVQGAFYGGYMVMAFPAAFFIKRYSYKSGILLGLALYAVGCLLFVPSGWLMRFTPFLIAYFIMTCGLAFLETCANPFILSMGPTETATRRLNFAQSFNPMGSIAGMFVASRFILAKLDPADEATRTAIRKVSLEQFNEIAQHDVSVIVGPYAMLGLVVLACFVVFFLTKLPHNSDDDNTRLDIGPTFKRLFTNAPYVEGVVTQTFYVGVQIMCWTFIIQYAGQTLGLPKPEAQNFNIIAMVMFVTFRFVCTFLLKFFNSGILLATLAIGGGLLIIHTMFGGGNADAGAAFTEMTAQAQGSGVLATIAVYLKAPFVIPGLSGMTALLMASACMSLMFPTIYGIALRNVGQDAKIGAAGLVAAIGGGCLMTLLQGWIMDWKPVNLGFTTLASVRFSFILPLLCFAVITAYGLRTFLRDRASRC
ncbi:MAG: L-fucose:H+ symporter permease [Kiritimatiellaeota bacterium]|nr:L-fucose:H+ symporter permease [Kiritimatiellota bacterium]